jgi:hypothetical protein
MQATSLYQNRFSFAAWPHLVEHEVKLMDFTKWLEKQDGSPREMSDRQGIRSILGIPGAR